MKQKGFFWRLLRIGQGPRPDLLFEETQEREEKRKLQERKRYENSHPVQPQGLHPDSNQERGLSNGPAVWNEEDSFASRAEDIPKPTKKDLLAMIIAMLELMLPIMLAFIAIFAVVIFLLQKIWLHG